MRINLKQIILFLVLALPVAGATWLWFNYMEKYWEAKHTISDEAKKNSMLGASRFLTQHRYQVDIENSLNDALINTPPNGTLLIGDNNGIMMPEQSKQLLAWVAKGNTLIAIPKRMSGKPNNADKAAQPAAQSASPVPDESVETDDSEDSEDSDENKDDDAENKSADETDAAENKKVAQPSALAPLVETDPIAAFLGVALVDDPSWADKAKKTALNNYIHPLAPSNKPSNAKENLTFPVSEIIFPDAAYALQVWRGGRILQTTKPNSMPLFSDTQGKAVRVYSHGKGHIVMIDNNYFSNETFAYFDHAEFLLALTQLNPSAKHFTIVQHLNMPHWMEMLWANYHLAIISIACALLLLFWRAIYRFGPVLPEPANDRRSLIEHIDASGRWLWKVPGGRQILLTSVRDSARQILHRRAPELQSLPMAEQIEHMAILCKLDRDELISAWQQPAAKLPLVFFRQIQTLQQLRKNYER